MAIDIDRVRARERVLAWETADESDKWVSDEQSGDTGRQTERQTGRQTDRERERRRPMQSNWGTLIYTRLALKGNGAWKGFLYSVSQQIKISVYACVFVCVCVRHDAKSCHINCKAAWQRSESSTKQTPKAFLRQAETTRTRWQVGGKNERKKKRVWERACRKWSGSDLQRHVKKS